MIDESSRIQWFEKMPKCRCGKVATGILRGIQNESFGHHCDNCAARRIKDSKAVRAAMEAERAALTDQGRAGEGE